MLNKQKELLESFLLLSHERHPLHTAQGPHCLPQMMKQAEPNWTSLDGHRISAKNAL